MNVTHLPPQPPPNSARVDPWETVDGRRRRFFIRKPRSSAGLPIKVLGFQQDDGTYTDVQIQIGDTAVDVDAIAWAIGDLNAAAAEAAALQAAQPTSRP